MTKNIFITAVAVLLSVALCPLWAQNVSEDCKVGEFSAINLRSVGNIIFHSVRYLFLSDGRSF